jgi:hypothetical protein
VCFFALSGICKQAQRLQVTDSCSKRVTVCLEANEAAEIKVTARISDGNTDRIFVMNFIMLQNNTAV